MGIEEGAACRAARPVLRLHRAKNKTRSKRTLQWLSAPGATTEVASALIAHTCIKNEKCVRNGW